MARGSRTEVDSRSLDEILKTLEKIDNLTQKQINAAARAGAKYIQRKAKEKAPVSADGSHGRPKGFLKKSIKIKAEKSKTKGKKAYSVGIGGDAYYGVFQEYGSKNNPARPFLRPALDENRDELKRIVLGEVAKGVDQAK